MEASYDNFTYLVNDRAFQWHINNGKSEPYGDGQYDFIKSYIRHNPGKNRTCLDVGAHIGTTMLPYSRLFKNVYGYEPNADNYTLCVQNIERNKASNCHVSNVAVLDEIVNGKTIRHGDNSGCYYFIEDSLGGEVSSTTVDMDKRVKDVDFIKIDTEGNELRVLKGAVNTITLYKPLLQIETNGLSEKHFGVPERDVVQFILNLGYYRVAGTEFYVPI